MEKWRAGKEASGAARARYPASSTSHRTRTVLCSQRSGSTCPAATSRSPARYCTAGRSVLSPARTARALSKAAVAVLCSHLGMLALKLNAKLPVTSSARRLRARGHCYREGWR